LEEETDPKVICEFITTAGDLGIKEIVSDLYKRFEKSKTAVEKRRLIVSIAQVDSAITEVFRTNATTELCKGLEGEENKMERFYVALGLKLLNITTEEVLLTILKLQEDSDADVKHEASRALSVLTKTG